MKKIPAAFTFFRKHGFTLVELLVVIAIIAILAGVLLTVATNVINIAKRTKAQNTASQIQTATLAYFTEYSVYPTPTGVSTDFVLTDKDTASGGYTGSNAWGPLIECLSGGIRPSTGGTVTLTTFTNSRSVAFINLKATDVDNGSTSTSIKDQDAPLNPLPYKSTNPYFNIAIDADYSGVIGPNDTTATTVLPNFAATIFNATAAAGGGSSTGGVAIWANCSPTGSTTQAGWYVRTY